MPTQTPGPTLKERIEAVRRDPDLAALRDEYDRPALPAHWLDVARYLPASVLLHPRTTARLTHQTVAVRRVVIERPDCPPATRAVLLSSIRRALRDSDKPKPTEAREAMLALAYRGYLPPDSEMFQELHITSLMVSPTAGELPASQSAASVLLGVRELPLETLLRYADRWPSLAVQVSSHPGATPAVWARVAAHGPAIDLYAFVALGRPLDHPEVLDALARHRSARLDEALCTNLWVARQGEAGKWLVRLMGVNPEMAVGIAQSYPSITGEITTELLTPLLSSRNGSVREAVIRLMAGAVPGTETPVIPATTPRKHPAR